MKSIITTILSIFILLPSIGTLVLFTHFKINQEQIAQTICVQRANINNICNGRCELQKSLKKFEDNERKIDSFKLKEQLELVYISNILPTFTYSGIHFYVKKNSFFYTLKKSTSFISQLFRPPLV